MKRCNARKALLAPMGLFVITIFLLTPSAQSAYAAPKERILTIAISGDVETLDSDFSHFTRSNEVNYNTQDRDFFYGWNTLPEGYSMYDPKVIKGGAIESWTVAPDGMSVTLNVRQGVKFNHTGESGDRG